MRRRTGLLVVLCALSASGCGVFLKSEGQKSAEKLLAVLPRARDMPEDWEETQREVFLERETEDPSVWCPQAADSSKDLAGLAGEAGAVVQMNAEKSEHPRMMRLEAWSNEDAAAYLSATGKSARACDGVISSEPTGVVVESHVISGRNVGDESVSWSVRVVPPHSIMAMKHASFGRTTVARFGRVVMVLQMEDAGPAGTTGFMPEDEWWQIVQTAAAKIAEAAR